MDQKVRIVAFTLDEHRYGLLLETVEHVTRMVEFVPLPSAPAVILGVVNFRGRIVPVLNLRLRFGLPGKHIALSDVLIVAKTPRRHVALAVDAVSGARESPLEDLIAAQDIVPGTRHVAGVLRLPDGMILIQDLDTVLSLDEEQVLDEFI